MFLWTSVRQQKKSLICTYKKRWNFHMFSVTDRVSRALSKTEKKFNKSSKVLQYKHSGNNESLYWIKEGPEFFLKKNKSTPLPEPTKHSQRM